MSKKKKKLSDFRPQEENANKHNIAGQKLLNESMHEVGFIGAMTAAADGEVFDGSLRIEEVAAIFKDVEPIVIESDGKRPIIVQRTDIPTAKSDKAVRAGLFANRVPEVGLTWDKSILKSIAEKPNNLLLGIMPDTFTPDGIGEKYSNKIGAQVYEPKEDKPEVEELYDQEKTRELIEKIKASSIPDHEKEFLMIAAMRHIVLRFDRIADFYAHSSEELQGLMEDSALVIIDFDQAIEKGYVRMSDHLAQLQEKEKANEK